MENQLKENKEAELVKKRNKMVDNQIKKNRNGEKRKVRKNRIFEQRKGQICRVRKAIQSQMNNKEKLTR